jgi:hypothetical protein
LQNAGSCAMCEKCEIHPNIRLVGEILALHEWHMEKS